jgi:hypothetical protein
MRRFITVATVAVTVAASAGCEEKAGETKAVESVPLKEAEPIEGSATEPSPCATPACEQACSEYSGARLKECAAAFEEGCFGPNRDPGECGEFGASVGGKRGAESGDGAEDESEPPGETGGEYKKPRGPDTPAPSLKDSDEDEPVTEEGGEGFIGSGKESSDEDDVDDGRKKKFIDAPDHDKRAPISPD